MQLAPASVNSVIVVISGVLQDPSTYSVSGTTLNFSAAPPTGTNNISVRYLGLPGIPNTPTTGSVQTAQLGNITNIASSTSLTLQTGSTPTTAITVDASQNLTYVGALTGGTGIVNLGSGQFYKDASGHVGIGTNSPAYPLHVTNGGGSGTLSLSPATTNGGASYILMGNSDSSGASGPSMIVSANRNLQFGVGSSFTAAGGGTFTEAMRLDSSGNLLVGTTSTSNSIPNGVNAVSITSGTSLNVGHANGTPNGYSYMQYAYNGTTIGYISQSGTTAVAYNTTSDYRLKENIAPMQNALNVIQQLKPVTYNWKSDGSNGQGFIAHELQSVVPDCVTGEKDAVDEEGKPVYQGIDTSFLVATLTAAIQELNAKVDAQAAEIQALKGVA
jgi:hypothetical protein